MYVLFFFFSLLFNIKNTILLEECVVVVHRSSNIARNGSVKTYSMIM